MKHHIRVVTRACCHQFRRLRQTRRRVGQDITEKLVLALIIPRLDYCNSVLAGLPAVTIEPLQRVQNAAARLIFDLRPRDHVSPCLIQLHRLPVRYRIDFKLATLMFSVANRDCPQYIAEMVTPVSAASRRVGLRSTDTSDFVVPLLRCKFGETAFSYAGPRI